MSKKLLVAYGTMSGSTADVAQAIGDEIKKGNIEVDIKPVEEIISIQDYDGVIVGSAVRMFNLLGKTKRFLRRHKKALQKVPVAYFLVCLTMNEETPENIEQAKKFAKPMFSTKEPVSLGLFGGCIDHEKLNDFFARPMKKIPEQDHRDWDKIRAWANELLSKFSDHE
jgi:menaquinone-dependent protoporphyrinogen oxidase